jgi:Fic family protein
MPYEPTFEITPRLLSLCEEVARLRQRIQDSSIELPWVPGLQKDMRTRNAHATTAIEGNPLTLPEVRALADGGQQPGKAVSHSKREVLNYFAGLRYLQDHSPEIPVLEAHVLELHRILGYNVMDQGVEGEYRFVDVSVGPYNPPQWRAVPDLMADLLAWWNESSASLSPVITSAVLHYRFEAIHPFGDVNGRAGRALALWELYRRGFDTHHIFAVDEYYWEDRPAYYAALAHVRTADEDLTQWLEYSAVGLVQTLGRVRARIDAIAAEGHGLLVLRPRQERLLELLRDTGSMTPGQIWEALGVSRQGAMDLLNPLLEAGLVEKVGTKKTGRYMLKAPDARAW